MSEGKVEKAKAKVVEEKEKLAGVEKEMVDGREPRCTDLDESGGDEGEAEEEEEKGVNLEGVKRRKVVRRERFLLASTPENLDVHGLIRILQ